MKINFLSIDFEKYLLKKLNVSEITDDVLKNVTEISLNKFNVDGTETDYDFRDFEKLQNLKFISLQNFIIKNYQTNEMNRCKNLEGIQFTNCIIKSKSRLLGDIQIITFDNCKRFKFKYISTLKKLKVVKFSNIKIINLKRIYMLKSVEKLYFENGIILHFQNLSKLNNLIYIRLLKCKWRKSDEKYFNKNVLIEK